MTQQSLVRGICTVLSYISAFTYGIYTYVSTHGQPIEGYRWLLTGIFGIFFYILSKNYKNE